MVELSASGDADQVEARLRSRFDAHGLQVFARIDRAAGARKADFELLDGEDAWAGLVATLAEAAADLAL